MNNNTRYKTRLFLEKNAKVLKQFSTCNKFNCNSFSDRDLKILFKYLDLIFNGICPLQRDICSILKTQYGKLFKKMCDIYKQNSNSFICNFTFKELIKVYYAIIPIFIENICLKRYNLKKNGIQE